MPNRAARRAAAVKKRYGSSTEEVSQETADGSKDESPYVLFQQLHFYKHASMCASSRKARVEELMQRPGAKTWDAPKKAKMVRRLVSANQELEQCTSAVDQLTHRISQLTTAPKKANNVAPFVPGPATSV